MGMHSQIIGNLLTKPELKTVKVKNPKPGQSAQRQICELRVMADVYKRDGEELVQDAEKSEPVNITIWNEKLASDVFTHFEKGARIIAIGDQDVQTWDKDGIPGYQVHLNADVVGLIPTRIESIKFRPRQLQSQAEHAESAS
jgi:hypothetical protein